MVVSGPRQIGKTFTVLEFGKNEYKNVVYQTCDLFFSAKIPEGAKFNPQESEVQSYSFVSASTKEEIEKIPLAFDSARKTLLKRLEILEHGE